LYLSVPTRRSSDLPLSSAFAAALPGSGPDRDRAALGSACMFRATIMPTAWAAPVFGSGMARPAAGFRLAAKRPLRPRADKADSPVREPSAPHEATRPP